MTYLIDFKPIQYKYYHSLYDIYQLIIIDLNYEPKL